MIACDPIVGANPATLVTIHDGRSYVALNTHGSPTAAFVTHPDWQFPAASCERAVLTAAGAANVGLLDADRLAVQLVGDSLYTNPLMLGYAWQKGKVPLSHAALMRAIETERRAGREQQARVRMGPARAAHDLPQVEKLLKPAAGNVIEFVRKSLDIDAMIAKRVEFLTAYQNAGYAAHYRNYVEKVRAAESKFDSKALTEAVARYLFKLMAYKDEYEVARLQSDPAFLAKVAAHFDGQMGKDYRLNYHLAPPLTAKKNAAGELTKSTFGPWMLTGFRVLAKLKGLRGTAFDPFARTAERRAERSLIDESTVRRSTRCWEACRQRTCASRPRSRVSPRTSAATAT